MVAITGLVMAAIWLGWLFFSEAERPRLAVTEDGEIIGMQNTMREALQGQRFWDHQLAQVDKELAQAEDFWADYERAAAESEDLDREMEALYRASPELRPPPELESREAVDQEEYVSAMLSYRIHLETEDVPRLKRIRSLIQRRLMAEQ